MLSYFSMSRTDEGYVPIFSHTKLFLVDLRPNNKVVFSPNAQETWVSVLHQNEAIGWKWIIGKVYCTKDIELVSFKECL